MRDARYEPVCPENENDLMENSSKKSVVFLIVFIRMDRPKETDVDEKSHTIKCHVVFFLLPFLHGKQNELDELPIFVSLEQLKWVISVYFGDIMLKLIDYDPMQTRQRQRFN